MYHVKYIYIQGWINTVIDCEIQKGLGKLILDKAALLCCRSLNEREPRTQVNFHLSQQRPEWDYACTVLHEI